LDYRKFLTVNQETYSCGLFNLTIDLELGWSRSKRGDRSIAPKESLERSRRAREVLPAFLGLCEEYDIPVTFAPVGHIALSDCSSHNSPPPFKPYWLNEDWFACDPRSSIEKDNDYYGLDLIEKICKSSVAHEIASHGFSHLDLTDEAITFEVAKFEIEESTKALKKFGQELTTFIFPHNKPAFIDLLKENGYRVYRHNKNTKIEKDEYGLWQFPVGLWLSPKAFSPGEFNRLIGTAVKYKRLISGFCHLYEFNNPARLIDFFRPIFQFINIKQKQGSLRVKTIRDIIKDI